jgi:hypothetical protein
MPAGHSINGATDPSCLALINTLINALNILYALWYSVA